MRSLSPTRGRTDSPFGRDVLTLTGGLLNRGVEIKRVAGADSVDQGLELGWWGCVGPGSPAALEGDPGVEPGADGADRLGPAGRLGLVGLGWAPSRAGSPHRSAPVLPSWRRRVVVE